MIHDPVSISAAFLIGLFSAVHCIGMCGSIIGALSLSLPGPIRDNPIKRFGFVSSYNFGRILSYGVAGMIIGGIGMTVFESSGSASIRMFAKIISTTMMIAIGLYLAGWFPQVSYIEKIGVPIWRKLEPIGRKMMPVDSIGKAFAYGLIWGWLPCGLVYTVLVWSLTTGSATNGALIMLAFGLGTLPTLITTGVMTSWITRFAQSPTARHIAGLIIIIMAIASLIIPIGMGSGEHHHH